MADAETLPTITLNISPDTDNADSIGILKDRWSSLTSKHDGAAPIRFHEPMFQFQPRERPSVACCSLPDDKKLNEWLIEVNMSEFKKLDMPKLDLTLLHEWIPLRYMNGHLKAERVNGSPMPDPSSLRVEHQQLIETTQGVFVDPSEPADLRRQMLSLELEPWCYKRDVFEQVRDRVQSGC